MIEKFHSDSNFSSTSFLMTYFCELMAQMQNKHPEQLNQTKDFKIVKMTDIFISSFQNFDNLASAFCNTVKKASSSQDM
jgi:predicted MPP superfamily phosphohydrolase